MRLKCSYRQYIVHCMCLPLLLGLCKTSGNCVQHVVHPMYVDMLFFCQPWHFVLVVDTALPRKQQMHICIMNSTSTAPASG